MGAFIGYKNLFIQNRRSSIMFSLRKDLSLIKKKQACDQGNGWVSTKILTKLPPLEILINKRDIKI